MNGVTDYLFKRLWIKLSILIISAFLLGAGLIGKVYADIPAIERAALIALYNSTDGDNWSDNSGWNGPLGTECNWYGVVCTGERVNRIELFDNQLTGSIPAELGNLTNLYWLDLEGNQLTGSIPAEIGNMIGLVVIYLEDNQLTGSIPSELGNLSNLVDLSLQNNQLTGQIPPELGNLTKMEEIYLYGNQLTGQIPAGIGNMANLQVLYLQDNQLTGSIPPELGNWPSGFCCLNLSQNQLSGSIPVELMNLIGLRSQWFDICGNHLFTSNSDLRDFLNNLQPGWENCQTPPFSRAMPYIPILLFGE